MHELQRGVASGLAPALVGSRRPEGPAAAPVDKFGGWADPSTPVQALCPHRAGLR